MEDEKYVVTEERNCPTAFLRFFGRDSGAAPELWSSSTIQAALTRLRSFRRSPKAKPTKLGSSR